MVENDQMNKYIWKVQNIESVLERGEKLELLVDKTDQLQTQVRGIGGWGMGGLRFYYFTICFTHLHLFLFPLYFFFPKYLYIYIYIYIKKKKKGFPISVHLEEVEKRNVDEKVENVCCLRTGRSNNHMGDIGNGLRNRLQQVWQQRWWLKMKNLKNLKKNEKKMKRRI
jgi:hypothetical protein